MSQNKTTVKQWLKNESMDLSNVDWDYNINGETKLLQEEAVLKAAIERLGEDRLVNIFNKFKEYFTTKWYARDKEDVPAALRNEVKVFLRDMSEYSVWAKEKPELNFKQMAIDYSMDEKFLKWWMKEKGFTKQQMLCEHDDSDQFSEDGNWYNSVGKCKKCLVETNDCLDNNEEVELVYKAWKRK